MLFRIPAYRTRLLRLYGSVENAKKEIRKTNTYVSQNIDWGINMQFASLTYGGSIIFYLWGLYFIVSKYIDGLLTFFQANTVYCAFGFVALALVIAYHVSFKKDVFKKYFKEFDKLKGWMRLASKIVVLIFVFGSFTFWMWAMDFAHH